MPVFKLPLSGDVVQTIAPWTAFLSPIGSQFGLVNINLGQSSNPKAEQAVLEEVGSYGKQLGRVEEALCVLLDHLMPTLTLTPNQQASVDALRALVADVAKVKAKQA